jgi:putative serine protease PepD
VGARPPAPRPARSQRLIRGRDVALAVGAGAFGALAMVAVLAVAGLIGDSPSSSSEAAPAPRSSEPDAASRLAAIANPSVVGILATTATGVRKISGVCVRNGQVITSAAAVAAATEITVVAADGTRRAGTLVGQDPSTRLALIRVNGGSDPAKLAADGQLKVGQWILALGGSDGSGPWVATGVVASLGGWAENGDGTPSAGMITVDAPMPPEAQGGALLDHDGHVVGILAGATKDSMGGLATPIATVRNVAAQLAETGTAAHGALGVGAADEDHPRGARVVSVLAQGAAARAGVETGDVVVKVDEQTVRNAADLVVAVRSRRPDERVTITVLRHRDPKELSVTLGDAESTEGSEAAATVSAG